MGHYTTLHYGVVVFPTLMISYMLGYMFKDSGVPLPGGSNIDLWGILVNNKPQAASTLAYENYLVWIVVYFTAHFLMYVKPQRDLFHPFKLNPNYPPGHLVLKEMVRSARGVAICTLYVAIVNQLYRTSSLPSPYVPSIFANDGQVSLVIHILGAVCIYLWADFHFYWTHRLLHTSRVYTRSTMSPTTRTHSLVCPCTGLSRLFTSPLH